MGFEPATACLQNRCSTVELRRRKDLGACRKNLGEKVGKNSPGPEVPRRGAMTDMLGFCDGPVESNNGTDDRRMAIHRGADTEIGGSPGTRTPNLLIKSQLLYH